MSDKEIQWVRAISCMAIPLLKGWMVVRLIYWLQPGDSSHTAASLPTGACIRTRCWQQYGFLHLTICGPDGVEGLERQADRGEPPITCRHCPGQCLIIPRLLATIHAIYQSHHLFIVTRIRESDEVWRGYMYINMSQIAPVWMPLPVQTSLFGHRQRLLLCVCHAGPRRSPSMACHSGDKHQLAAHSTDTSTSSQSQQITF